MDLMKSPRTRILLKLEPIALYVLKVAVLALLYHLAARLGQHGTTLTTFILSGVAIWGTVQGLGPFALESINDSLVLLQTFMAVVSLTGLILAAATLERSNASRALQQRAEELATLNDSSKTFLDSFEITNIYRTICHLVVTRPGLDVAWNEEFAGENQSSHYSIFWLAVDSA